MSWLTAALRQRTESEPDQVALCAGEVTLSYADVFTEVERLTGWLSGNDAERIGLLLDNSPAWALLDIGCLSAEKVLIPIPAFFSSIQIAGLIADADVDLLLTDQPDRLLGLGCDGQGWRVDECRQVADTAISCLVPNARKNDRNLRPELPAGTAKITYTSGSTGDPKGVCLTSELLHQVTTELTAAMKIDNSYQHLCLLPLAVLLENVAGLYVALLGGASCRLEPLEKLGWRGMTDFDFTQLAAVMATRPVDSLILVPALLTGLLALAEHQPGSVNKLRLVAVGGAAVPASQLRAAEQLGLPLYQGYGLSECGSVVAVNSPGANRLGSVGKPLPHQQLTIINDGEIWIDCQGVAAYLGREESFDHQWWPTGDRGHLDSDGYLYIEGRQDNLLLTPFGRNVSPEWVEGLLIDQPVIQQAVVLSGGTGHLEALLVSKTGRAEQLEQAVVEVNKQLPDYAHVMERRACKQPLTLANGLLTRGGLPSRGEVAEYYQQLPFPTFNVEQTAE